MFCQFFLWYGVCCYDIVSPMKMNNILRKIVFIGLFAVPFIPLIVSSGMFFPFITGKNFAFRIIVEIILAAWAVLAARDSVYRPKKSLILGTFAVFIGVIAVADIFGENFYRSFWSNYERMEGLVAHLHLFGYFVVATAMLSTEKLWQKFFYTSFGVNLAIIVYSFFQLAGKLPINQGGVRVDATFGNTTYLAVYLLFQIFLLSFYLIRGGESQSKDMAIYPLIGAGLSTIIILISLVSPFRTYFLAFFGFAVIAFPLYLLFQARAGKIFLWLFLLADIFILYRTETRGAVLGLAVGVLVSSLILAVGNLQNKKVRNIAVGVFAALIILSGLLVSMKNTPFVKSSPTLTRLSSISLSEGAPRFMVWGMSFQGVKEHPILGWGQDNFIVVFSKYYNPQMWSQEPWFDRSHNVFFDWMIAGGLLGLLAYLALFGAGVYVLWKGKNFSFTEKSLFTGLLAGYFFQNLFVFDNITSYIMFFSVLGFIAVMNRKEGETDAGQRIMKNKQSSAVVKSNHAGLEYVLAPAVLIVFVIVFYFANVKPLMASSNLISGISAQKEGPGKNLEYFKNVFALNTFGSGEAREQLIQVAAKIKQGNMPNEIKQQFFDLAREQMLIQITEAPTDARYEFYLGVFFDNFGFYDEAIKHLTRAVELSPKKQMILFATGSAYISKRDIATGFKYFKQAYEEDPNYPDALLSYATVLVLTGQNNEAEKLVLEARKAGLTGASKYQQIEVALAAAYLRAGEREKSIGKLQEISAENPSFKDQAEKFISEIRAGRNP